MEQLKNYIQLHLNILLFSLTGIFSKLASIQYNKNGLHAPLLYLFAFLMLANCGVYALAWQKIIKKFSVGSPDFPRISFLEQYSRHAHCTCRRYGGAAL